MDGRAGLYVGNFNSRITALKRGPWRLGSMSGSVFRFHQRWMLGVKATKRPYPGLAIFESESLAFTL